MKGRIIEGQNPAELPKIKFVIFVAGAKLRDPKIVEIFDTPIDRPTLHFLGKSFVLEMEGIVGKSPPPGLLHLFASTPISTQVEALVGKPTFQ